VDVLQEVFRAVVSHIGAFRKTQRGDTFRGWLRTVWRSKVHDLFRRRQREPEGAGGTDAQRRLAQWAGPPAPGEEDSDDRNAERALLHRALALIRSEFEERTWQAFWRTTVEGREAKAVGDELGMSPGAVRVAKSRVLHRLRDTLGDLGE
jgi:RNA polymerase sigma-70 factor (ECF subfamily)